MYKNFNLTESERERILGMHKERGYKKALNEQEETFDMGADSHEGEIDEARGRKGDVTMAVWSHLNDIGYDDPEQRKVRVNFLKLLVEKFIPSDAQVSVEALDNLWEQVSNGDFSGSALDEPMMGEI